MSDVVDELSSFQASKGVDDAMIDFTQEIVVMSMEEVRVPNTSNSSYSNSNLAKPYPGPSYSERRARPQKEAALKCPRCDSTNTKFCYYNDYSLSKPRYFCKTCRKYWTNGGTLANIPVGDGSRKNKTSSSVAKTTFPKVSELLHHFNATRNTNASVSTTTTTTNNTALALELLKASVTSTGSFMPIPIPPPDSNSVYTHMPEFKIPSLSFSLDGMGSGNGGRLLFPFEELKTNTSATHDDDPPHIGQNKDQNCDSNGFWNGMMDEAAHD